MKLNITQFHFKELLTRGYSLDIVFMLLLVHAQEDLETLCKENLKASVLYQTLLRKALITEDNKLTTLGIELLDFINSKSPRKIQRKKVDDSLFGQWWSEYPSSDSFEYKGKEFKGCRTLRINEEECRLKFDKILSEGIYTSDDLVNALKLEVYRKLEMSYKTGENKMSYMKGSLPYLNQRAFVSVIEEIRRGAKIVEQEENTFNGINI
jgi:hypothetical protein